MKTIIRVLLMLLVIAAGGAFYQAAGQEKEGMVEYTPDFRFNDGVYLNFDQVKANSPIPKAKILTSTDYNDKDFFKNLLESDKIYFYDGMGVRQEIDKSEIWAFARNGILYVQVQGNFNRITFIGNICHFVADVTSYDSRYYNSPYGYYDPYGYSPYSMYPYGMYSPYSYGNYYSPYGSYYSPYGRNSMGRNELRQYLIDFETGNVLEYDVENTELLLMKDTGLYEEYMNLPRKKRKDLMFVYIRKFNERNPLYIPSNQEL